MKRVLLLITYNVSLIAFCAAQNPLVKQWDKRFGGTAGDRLYSFHQTSDGGYILGGYSLSSLNGDKTQNSWGSSDYWIVKTDSLGSKQWDKRFGGMGSDLLYSMQQTADGGYILGGISQSGIGGDKTQPSWDTCLGCGDYWIVKIDSLGNKQWDKDYGGTGLDLLYSLQQTTDGGYILGGYSLSGMNGDKTQASWGQYDYWIVKTDSFGNKLWDKDFGGNDSDILNSLQQTADGGYILGGYSSSDSSGDKTQMTWGGSDDYWIVKTDSLGNKQWDKDFGGTYNDFLFSLQQTTDRGYILGGNSLSGISGDKTQSTWGPFSDFWIVKTDSLGDKQWDKDFGGTSAEDLVSILLTEDKGYLLSGESYSQTGGNKTENNLGVEQSWIIKTDSSGNLQWDKTIFTTGHDENGLAALTNDRCYVFANYTSAGIGGYKTQPAWSGSDDYWIIKFCDTTSTTSITQLPGYPITFSLSPNPAKELLVISDNALRKKIQRDSLGEIEIYDLFGRRILHSLFNIQHSSFTIDISSLSPGIYFLKAGNEVRKFVKE